ncbi:NF-kappa-B-activating protein-like [Macaca thibetana thibetana]|uniref:NF-kappa-B-activating protein-like n=1 Tax=Macaca thibetana thibetana TaxID=257877 RepID=UPI0021BCB589|nr:NF-kappa-B-activating protein-like [Macaca thibetana thibetana]
MDTPPKKHKQGEKKAWSQPQFLLSTSQHCTLAAVISDAQLYTSRVFCEVPLKKKKRSSRSRKRRKRRRRKRGGRKRTRKQEQEKQEDEEDEKKKRRRRM